MAERTSKSVGVDYLVAIAATAAMVMLRWLLDPWMGNFLPLVTLYGAVAVAVWFAGYRPALVATALGFLACDFLFIAPRGSFGMDDVRDYVGLVLYLFTCALIIGFGEGMRVAQRRIQESQERLRTTLASIGDAVIATDTEGRITNMNAVAESLTGWKHSEAVGQPITTVFRIVNEQTRMPVEDPIQKVLKLGRVVGLANHTALIARDGTERPIDDSAAPIRCKMGQIVGCVLIFRDVTARRRAETLLRESEDRLRLALEAGRIGTWEWTIPTNEVIWSPGLETIHGLAPGTFPGTFDAYQRDIHPADRETVLRAIAQTVERGEDHHIEYRIVLPSGSIRWVEGRGRLFREPSGAPSRMIGVCSDITDRKEPEEELRRAEELVRSVVSNAIDAIITIDERGTVESFNPAAERVFGFTKAEMIGQNVNVLMPAPHLVKPVDFAALMKLLAESPASARSLPSSVTDVGEPAAVSVSEESPPAPESDAEYFSNIAHDLAGCLFGIKMAAEVLGRLELDEKAIRAVKFIDKDCKTGIELAASLRELLVDCRLETLGCRRRGRGEAE